MADEIVSATGRFPVGKALVPDLIVRENIDRAPKTHVNSIIQLRKFCERFDSADPAN